MGDTNSGLPEIDEEVPCFGPAERVFFGGLARWGYTDAFRALAADARVYTWYSPNGGNGFRLDQGFVSPGLRGALRAARYCWAGGRESGLSDHAALLLDFDARASAIG